MCSHNNSNDAEIILLVYYYSATSFYLIFYQDWLINTFNSYYNYFLQKFIE